MHESRQDQQNRQDEATAPEDPVRLRQHIEQLKNALVSRAEIDQALGVIMALGPYTRDHAWEALVQVSQRTNTKLRVVAAAIVATPAGRAFPEELRPEIVRALSPAQP